MQRQIDRALAGISIIVETIGPWKSLAGSQTLPPARATAARADRRPIMSSAFAAGNNGRTGADLFA